VLGGVGPVFQARGGWGGQPGVDGAPRGVHAGRDGQGRVFARMVSFISFVR
jgi:hypothetical protein